MDGGQWSGCGRALCTLGSAGPPWCPPEVLAWLTEWRRHPCAPAPWPPLARGAVRAAFIDRPASRGRCSRYMTLPSFRLPLRRGSLRCLPWLAIGGVFPAPRGLRHSPSFFLLSALRWGVLPAPPPGLVRLRRPRGGGVSRSRGHGIGRAPPPGRQPRGGATPAAGRAPLPVPYPPPATPTPPSPSAATLLSSPVSPGPGFP